MIDLDKFRAAKFEARTESVLVPQLADLCPPGTEPAFVVRGLTSN